MTIMGRTMAMRRINYASGIILIYLTKTALLILLCTQILFAQDESSIVYLGSDNRLTYVSDMESNRIPDFSHAGYEGGGVPLPQVKTVLEIEPIAGDNTSHIQTAIDSVSAAPIDANGFRGALLLKPGTYLIDGVLFVRESGVVLRGSGNQTDPATNTILIARGDTPHQRTLISVGAARVRNWKRPIANTQVNIITEFVPIGARSFEADDVRNFKVGDPIIIFHKGTDKWCEAVRGGEPGRDDPWTGKTGIDIVYRRDIIAIAGNLIQVNAPVFNHLDRSLSQSVIYKLDVSGFRERIGMENFRVVVETAGELDENHAKRIIEYRAVENCWAQNVTALHFGYSAIEVREAYQCTFIDCEALEPHAKIRGGRRYNFCCSPASNNILFQNCLSSNGRHDFVSNGEAKVSGMVVLNSSVEENHTGTEGHRRWSQGLLFDRVSFRKVLDRRTIALYNRGDWGTSHGWASAHSVAWNCDSGAGQIVIQKPPTAQNYGIGCIGKVVGVGPFITRPGFIEKVNSPVMPASLYLAQLEERLNMDIQLDAPAKLRALLGKDRSKVTLTWDDITMRETGFYVERALGKGTFERITTIDAGIESYVDVAPPAGTVTYRLMAFSDISRSAYSNPAIAEFPAVGEQ